MGASLIYCYFLFYFVVSSDYTSVLNLKNNVYRSDISSQNMYLWKQVSAVLDRDVKWLMPGTECVSCLHEPLITCWGFSRQICPRGWLSTIAFPSPKSQVCVAEHTSRQWKLAVWMMVITHTAETTNASFQEGAVWWASLMSAREQEFIYLLLVWLNCSCGETSDRVVVYLTMH